jgi:hypothetical protein
MSPIRPNELQYRQGKRQLVVVLCDASQDDSWLVHLISAVFQEQGRSRSRVDIEAVEIALDLGQGKQASIHDAKPEFGNISQKIGAEVAGWKAG